MYLQRRLVQWRDEQARMEGVESFRVLSKATLDAIVEARPKTKEELLGVKGIKERKYQKYGKTILSLIEQENEEVEEGVLEDVEEVSFFQEPLSVSQFLDGVNTELSGMAARIQGEVTSIDIRERVVYFTLKDSADGSTLACLIFRYAYQVSGVAVTIGDEIIVEGAPEIYKPSGRLSFKAGTIELAGEGALKKSYDELFLKLQNEGVFALENKKKLPDYSERVALITSKDGAAIDDFKMNLQNYGFKIGFYPTAVEGKKAVFEILEAIKYFRTRSEEYDVLVIVRGGGSLESLQAFNNEALVREIAAFPLPTLLGVGHEKDITLAALASDTMVSTPTATAQTLSAPWVETKQLVGFLTKELLSVFSEQLRGKRISIEKVTDFFLYSLQSIKNTVKLNEYTFLSIVVSFKENIVLKQKSLEESRERFLSGFIYLKKRAEKEIVLAEEAMTLYDPKRVLRLGYGIIRKGITLVKDASTLKQGDILSLQLAKGSIETEVKKIIK